MATIEDIQALGYTVGIAHGDVETEETALHNAKVKRLRRPSHAWPVRSRRTTLADLANAGKLPVALDEQQAFAVQLLEEAKAMVAGVANENAEFHQRALEEARPRRRSGT